MAGKLKEWNKRKTAYRQLVLKGDVDGLVKVRERQLAKVEKAKSHNKPEEYIEYKVAQTCRNAHGMVSDVLNVYNVSHRCDSLPSRPLPPVACALSNHPIHLGNQGGKDGVDKEGNRHGKTGQNDEGHGYENGIESDQEADVEWRRIGVSGACYRDSSYCPWYLLIAELQ